MKIFTGHNNFIILWLIKRHFQRWKLHLRSFKSQKLQCKHGQNQLPLLQPVPSIRRCRCGPLPISDGQVPQVCPRSDRPWWACINCPRLPAWAGHESEPWRAADVCIGFLQAQLCRGDRVPASLCDGHCPRLNCGLSWFFRPPCKLAWRFVCDRGASGAKV